VKDDGEIVEADELGQYVLVVGTEAERHEQEKEVMPDQLIVQPKETEDELTD
jgi:hypothetical protein